MRLLVISLLILPLIGCFKTARDFATTPTPKLCIDYLNSSPYNVNYSAREEALYIRGEDCSDYVDAAIQARAARASSAAAAQQRNQMLIQQGQELMRQGAPRTYSPPSGTGIHSYTIDGRRRTCSTIGNTTNCY